jgi:hypothetical protein
MCILHHSGVLLRLTCVVLIFVTTMNFSSYAQSRAEWYFDPRIRTAAVARVDIRDSTSRSFSVIFEYERKCDPIFSMFIFRGSELGVMTERHALPPNRLSLRINDVNYSWYGMRALYTQSTELGVGVNRDAWNALLNDPRSVAFVDAEGKAHDVPLSGMGRALRHAAEACARRR